jgi:hypothetical protein
MRHALLAASFAALAFTAIPPALFLAGALAEGAMKAWLLAGTVLWFATWPLASRG